MGRRIDDRPTTSFGFSANFGPFDVLNVRMRCGASWCTEDTRTERKAHPRGLRQHPAGPVGCFSRWRTERQATTLCTCRLAAVVCRACASCRASALRRLRHEPGLPSPHHWLGFARAAHDLGGAAAFNGGQKMLPATRALRRAAIRDDRLCRWRSAG